MDYLDIPIASFPDDKITPGHRAERFGCELYNGTLFVSLNIFLLVWRAHPEPTTRDLFVHIEMNPERYMYLLRLDLDEIALTLTELHEYLASRPRERPAAAMSVAPLDPLDPAAIDSGWPSPDHAPPSQPHAA